MEINEIYYGFKLENKSYNKEIDSTLYEFKHLHSNATLVYIESDDNNKTFTIGFKTLPKDSTGICHIIEHTVLCGSQKFPLKEPFVNLLKGSMATFLNAFTSSDYTAYPVASLNDKDFHNLVETYLDAVFSPLSIIDDKPFLQEGWHYELLNEEDNLKIKGVVYNEMKGALSSAEAKLEEALDKEFYKGSIYSNNSGGDPDIIPTLSYEDYKNFYNKYYHPSNSIITFYGKLDILSYLEFLDIEYLSKYDKPLSEIKINKPNELILKDYSLEYELPQTESLENNSYIGIEFRMPDFENQIDNIALDIIINSLFSTNSSPLKKRLLELNIVEDIEAYTCDDSIVPNLKVIFKKTNKENKELLYNTLISELEEIVKNGLDKKTLKANINFAQFKNKELDVGTMPKGIIFSLSLIQAHNYNIKIEEALIVNKHYKELKKLLDTNYFEELIEKYIINSKHYVIVTLNPSYEYGIKKEEEFKNKMKEIKDSLSHDEILNLIKKSNELLEYQSNEDSKEDLEKLPKLELSDISSEYNVIPSNIYKEDNCEYIIHNFNTNSVAYLNLYFDLKTLTKKELQYALCIPRLFQALDTNKYSSIELLNYIKTYLGGLGFSFQGYAKSKDDYGIKMKMSTSALTDNISYIPEIINELINNLIFDENKIQVVLNQNRNSVRESLINNGTSIASFETQACHTKIGSIYADIIGYNRYLFINEVSKDVNKFILKIKEILPKIFNKNNLFISISGNDEMISNLKFIIKDFKFDNTKYEEVFETKLKENKLGALIISSDVSYNAKSINLNDYDINYDGSLAVLSHILRYDYLWNNVRVKGGAYGTGISISPLTGEITFSSYRDPSVKKTYRVFDNVKSYLDKLNLTKEDLKTYIIGCIGAFDIVGSNTVLIDEADILYLTGRTKESQSKIKQQILDTTLEKIKSYSSLFEYIKKESSIYTVGTKNKISKMKKIEEINQL